MMSSYECMYLKWGTVGEKEKGRGGERGEVSTQATRDQSGWELQHNAKEGFQVSKRGSGTEEGFSRQRRIIKGIVPCTSDIMPALYRTYRANCVCIVLIKNCV
jgi:hypothetical protein